MGRLLGIARRPAKRGPMDVTDAAAIFKDTGLEGERRSKPGKRQVTVLTREGWEAAVASLGADLPWTTRRANVLIDAPTLETLIGHTVRLGHVRIEVLAETDPCHIMDRQHPGLRHALEPDCRGGIYGRILCDGAIAIGDELRFDPPTSSIESEVEQSL